MTAQDEFLQRILSAFKIEAEEIIDKITASLIKLEKISEVEEQQPIREEIYRFAHTLKGAARAVDILEVETVCQEMESVFSLLKTENYSLTPKQLEIFFQTVETISKILAVRINHEEGIDFDVNGIVIQLQNFMINLKTGKTSSFEVRIDKATAQNEINQVKSVLSEQHSISPEREPILETPTEKEDINSIRVSTQQLDKILLQVEDLLSVKLSAAQVLSNLNRLIKNFQLWEVKIRDILPDVRFLQNYLDHQKKAGDLSQADQAVENAVRYLLRGNSLSRKTGQQLERLHKYWDRETFSINTRVDNLLVDVKKVVTVPFSELLQLFPKIVRDFSRDSKKSVKLMITGESIKIDRRILESLKNPLIHLLRNCLDHGIEKPSVRKRKKKPETGLIRINLERSENKKIRFTIEDDGAGINLNKLKLTVQKIQKYSTLDLERKENLLPFIFKSGISTSDMITEISGRGLGLAIVQKAIEDLEGTIRVESEKDQGTKFIIELPISLVTFRGIIVRVKNREFVLPTTKLDHVLFLRPEEVQSIENKRIIIHKKEFVPLADLGAVLGEKIKYSQDTSILAILINDGHRQIALRVDSIENEQEILAKNFNKHLKRIRNIAGATILGTGKVVPILNPADLIRSVFNDMTLISKHEAEEKTEKKKILVVEDSITSRMLMKGILENAGYNVDTAFDGMDGYIKVIEGDYDLVISDVDMPRMSGFDMTAKIRSDRDKCKVPVIMVTSLNSEEDLKKGRDAGANGYIVKSNFAQSDLESIIEKLLQEKK